MAVLAYPFPFMRAALPLPVFIGTFVVSIVLTQFALAGVTALSAGRTPGMFLFGLHLCERPGPVRAGLWAAGWVAAFVPGLLFEAPLGASRGWSVLLSGIDIGRSSDR